MHIIKIFNKLECYYYSYMHIDYCMFILQLMLPSLVILLILYTIYYYLILTLYIPYLS